MKKSQHEKIMIESGNIQFSYRPILKKILKYHKINTLIFLVNVRTNMQILTI